MNNENETNEKTMTNAYIVDDFLDKSYADVIERVCLSDLPWYFLEDITHGGRTSEGMQKVPAFTHVFADAHTGASGFFPLVNSVPYKKPHVPESVIKRAVAFLQMPTNIEGDSHNNIHTDMTAEHLVLLYYVNDSDGDTYFFDADDNVIQTVSPKKNRAVIFNGSIRHASSRPKTHARCVINFNLIATE